MHHHRKHLIAWIALLSVPISGMSIDIYVPSLPAVSDYFHTDASLAQLTITSYMIGYGFAQLIAGNIADSIGRKQPFIIASLLFIITTLFAPYVDNIYQLLFLRLIQGIAVACLNVPMRAVISDLFEGPDFYKMMNYMTLAWAIGPIIAPAIGGYLEHYIGWYGSFYFLTVYGVLMLLLNILFMPETLSNKSPFRWKQVLTSYQCIFPHRGFLIGLSILGATYSMLVLFGIAGSFLIQTVLHYSPIAFGHVALFMGLAWFLGNIANRIILNTPLMQKALICFSSMFLASLVMLFFALTQINVHLASIVTPTFVLIFLGGILFPNYFARNVAYFPELAGTANSLTGAFTMLIASVCTAIGAQLQLTTLFPLAMVYVCITLFCLVICYLDFKRQATNPAD